MHIERLWSTVIANELYSLTMQNVQVFVLSVWEPTDKILISMVVPLRWLAWLKLFFLYGLVLL